MPLPLPHPADPAAAERLRERFAGLGPDYAAFAAANPALLDAIGGNSPYLADLALREPATLTGFVSSGPNTLTATAFAELGAVPATASRATVAAAMRRAKRVVALAVALADIAGAWRLAQITATLTGLAGRTLRLATDHLLAAAGRAGELCYTSTGSGLTVLAMGKLGAGELNYSSDIDLILLYDPDAHPDHSAQLRQSFTRFARGLATLMEARDADGYVFRTDFRLRPDPAATPPAISLPAAIAYYESMGQNWERAAMIKARPIAGDFALGAHFLEAIRPFVWRRGLDFAAVADIHAMKRRVDQHKGTALQDGSPLTRLLGHDVKLGQGGIREIEFLTQTLQLVWGGRNPALREPATLAALRLLAGTGRLTPRVAGELRTAYRTLRRVEHRLQMVADRQTHQLPDTPEAFNAFATFMGYPHGDAFARALLRHMERVIRRYREVFDTVPPQPTPALDLSGASASPETLGQIAAMGFAHPEALVATLRGWQAGRTRALRSARARELMDAVLPALLPALGRQPEPDAAFARLDSLIERLPAGVQLLSTFQRNPAVMDRIAAILGAAPLLAGHLAAAPAAIEGLLEPTETTPGPETGLATALADARDLQDAIAATRRFVLAEEFRLGVAQLEGRLDVDAAGLARSALADAAIAALLPRVLADQATRNGHVRGGAMAVVVLGKAGGREMMAGSDLDLMLLHAYPPQATESRGARRVPSPQWFARAAHAVVAALTAPGAEGPLYQVDMRLRPSGNKGPVAVSLPAFQAYHARDAWTWERMALLRARVAAAPPALRARAERAIATAIGTGDPVQVRADAHAMRARMLRDLPPNGPWDVKLRPGGLVEVEFIAQALCLAHGVREPTTRDALAALERRGALPAPDAAMLTAADRLWRTIQSMLRLTVGRDPATVPAAASEALLRAAGEVDLAALHARMQATAHDVRAAFERHLGALP